MRAAVMRPSVVAIGLGLAAGLTATLGAGRWLTSLLYGVTPTDPATLVIVLSILSATGLAAATLAAARVLRTDPAPVLRAEGPGASAFPFAAEGQAARIGGSSSHSCPYLPVRVSVRMKSSRRLAPAAWARSTVRATRS
jgi:hypothetical protein